MGSGLSGAGTGAAAPGWTVLVYRGGDNNLEPFVLEDLDVFAEDFAGNFGFAAVPGITVR